ncbi:MAG: response regulator, partial [Lachnospiraceae bacterium]|nr:response regulator [Lachnospiraceae bacterium]
MNIAICDDEKTCRDTVLAYLKPFDNEENALRIFQFESGEAVLASYQTGAVFHLIFLDVEMKGLSGVETAKRIRERDKNAIFIFVTNHQKYVPDAFIVNAFQFLTKPLKQELFNAEFARAL